MGLGGGLEVGKLLSFCLLPGVLRIEGSAGLGYACYACCVSGRGNPLGLGCLNGRGFVGTALLLLRGSGSLFGDGLRCVGGSIQRLQIVPTDAAGAASTSLALSVAEGLSGGERRHYQYWYRDVAGPCAQGFNTSQGLAVQW